MKKILFFCVALFVVGLLINCTNQPEAADNTKKLDYQYLSNAYCDCAQKSIELNNKMKAMMDRGENEGFEAMVPEVSQAFKQSVNCCQKTKTTHSDDLLDNQKLGRLLKKDCPEMPPRLVLELLKKIK